MKVSKTIVILGAASVLGLVVAPMAHASDPTDVTVDGGSLTITNPLVANFGSVTLDGTAKTTTAAVDNYSVTDARGTGAGWNVTVQATQFQEWDGSQLVAGGKMIPQNSLSMPAPTVAKGDVTSSALPSITAGPYSIDAAAVKIASAGTNNGMGSYNFTQGALSLNMPAQAFAKTYRSTVTLSVINGP